MVYRSIISWCLVAGVLTACAPSVPDPPANELLDTRGVVALLDVMDAVAALHPGFAAREEAAMQLPEAEREAMLAEARARNEASVELGQALDAMFATETYRVYFRRFTNVTPELLRDIVMDLPFRRRSAPGDIGGLYYSLVRERDAVRRAVQRLVSGVDMGAVYRTAERWAPPSVEGRPIMHLIYDSNAGSFAAEGKPFLNVHTSMDLTALEGGGEGQVMAEVQGVMAHELQHVLADPVLYPAAEADRAWQAEWVDRLTRGLVGEGIANHCNPPTGVKEAVYEDTTVVRALVARLGGVLIALSDGEMTEDDIRAWYRANYSTEAEALLRQSLARLYEGDALEAAIRDNMSIRPDVEHALGWWMTSTITGGGTRREAAIGLLRDPYSVYEEYNASLAGGDPGLRIAPAAIAYVRSLRPETEGSDPDVGAP